MIYLFTQVWIYILIALVLGFVAGWLLWARPIQKAVAELEKPELEKPELEKPGLEKH